MHSKFYLDYLKSPEWNKKRTEKLQQVGYKCEYEGHTFYHRDGSVVKCSGSLQVHHKHYRSLGNENLFDLSVACEVHHKLLDGILRGKKDNPPNKQLYPNCYPPAPEQLSLVDGAEDD